MYMLFVFPGRFFIVSCILVNFYDPVYYMRHLNVFVIAAYFLEISTYTNNMGNVFIYTWLIVGFRRFLQIVFTFGLLERQSNQVIKEIKIKK